MQKNVYTPLCSTTQDLKRGFDIPGSLLLSWPKHSQERFLSSTQEVLLRATGRPPTFWLRGKRARTQLSSRRHAAVAWPRA